jgi:Icc-related predicted phosphoesterase
VSSVRIAAVADIHVGAHGTDLVELWADLEEHADLLLLAGDLTKCGTREEADVVAAAVAPVGVPVVAVLGNHDVHSDQGPAVVGALEAAGVRVLEGDACTLDIAGTSVGIAGVKGFGGGFPGSSCADFGEPEMKAFVHTARTSASALRTALDSLDAEVLVALMHYAPCRGTLVGEPEGIHAFLGCYQLGEAVDQAGADLAIHGHAHAGSRRGATEGGVPTFNVARPVLGAPYTVLTVDPEQCGSHRGAAAASAAGGARHG